MKAQESQSPVVKGWCPGAHRPMMSGDGLVVRIRPFRGSLLPHQVRALCQLSRRYGNGTLDLTTRANLQIRGIAKEDHPAVLQKLQDLQLIDEDPEIEGRRNILVAPDWQAGDLTETLYTALMNLLPKLPKLPEKMGYAVDTGLRPHLSGASADFRFETNTAGRLLLRADGAPSGFYVNRGNAMSALVELVLWFIDTGGRDAGRMARHLQRVALPQHWQVAKPRTPEHPVTPAKTAQGTILGVAFGSMSADALEDLGQTPGLEDLRFMPNRLIWLRGAHPEKTHGFITNPDSALLSTHACPGAPYCPQATVETRGIAERLAGQLPGVLHVSGCSKGCALSKPAEFTLIGRDGRFDLVRNGRPWDEPIARGLHPKTAHDLTGMI